MAPLQCLIPPALSDVSLCECEKIAGAIPLLSYLSKLGRRFFTTKLAGSNSSPHKDLAEGTFPHREALPLTDDTIAQTVLFVDLVSKPCVVSKPSSASHVSSASHRQQATHCDVRSGPRELGWRLEAAQGGRSLARPDLGPGAGDARPRGRRPPRTARAERRRGADCGRQRWFYVLGRRACMGQRTRIALAH